MLRASVETVAELSKPLVRGLPFSGLRRRMGAHYPAAERARIERLAVPRTTLLSRDQSGVLSTEESESET